MLLVISSAVVFLLWYSFTGNAAEIQPLLPVLQSYWMKIHVPENFIGYGAFAIAAMVGSHRTVRHAVRFCRRQHVSSGLHSCGEL